MYCNVLMLIPSKFSWCCEELHHLHKLPWLLVFSSLSTSAIIFALFSDTNETSSSTFILPCIFLFLPCIHPGCWSRWCLNTKNFMTNATAPSRHFNVPWLNQRWIMFRFCKLDQRWYCDVVSPRNHDVVSPLKSRRCFTVLPSALVN